MKSNVKFDDSRIMNLASLRNYESASCDEHRLLTLSNNFVNHPENRFFLIDQNVFQFYCYFR